MGRRPSRKWCRSDWCVSGRAAEARVGCAWEGRDVAIGGDGVRIARKGIVRERGVCGWSVAEAGEGGHRAWRGDAHRTALREQGCAGHAAGGCQGGAVAPEGRPGLGDLCVGRVVQRHRSEDRGGGRGARARRGGQRVQRHLVRSLGAALRFCRSHGKRKLQRKSAREEEAATEVCTGRGSTATEVCTGRGRGSKLSKQGRRGRISQCTGTLKKCRSSSISRHVGGLATPITFGPWALWLGGRARVPGEEHLLSCCGWIIREGSGGRVSPTGAIRVGRIALCNTISPYTHISMALHSHIASRLFL